MQWQTQDFIEEREPTKKGVTNLSFGPKFLQKRNENEENCTKAGDSRPNFYYVDPPLVFFVEVNASTPVPEVPLDQ